LAEENQRKNDEEAAAKMDALRAEMNKEKAAEEAKVLAMQKQFED